MFGALVVGLSVLLAGGFGELLKHRIQRDAGNSLQVVARKRRQAAGPGPHAVQPGGQVMASAEVVWSRGSTCRARKHMLARPCNPNVDWRGRRPRVVRNATGGLLVGQAWPSAPVSARSARSACGRRCMQRSCSNPCCLPPRRASRTGFVDFATHPHRPHHRGRIRHPRQLAMDPRGAQASRPLRLTSALELFIFDRQGTLIFAPGGRTEVMRAAGQRLPGAFRSTTTATAAAT